MKINLFLMAILISLVACSKDEHVNGTEKPSNEDKYEPGSLKYHYFVELGLKPSQIDSIDYIGDYIEKEDYSLMLGQRNSKAWISCFYKSGKEKFSFELPLNDAWKYSHYNRNSVLLVDESYIFLRGWQTNNPDNDAFCDFVEYISILNIETGKETDTLKPLKMEHPLKGGETTIIASNKRYLIRRRNIFDQGYDYFYVVNDEGKSLYSRNWTSNENSLFGSGVIFINNNIVANAFIKGTHLNNGTSYSIVNLKDWKLLRRLDKTNGFNIQGDNAGDNNVYYISDTTFIDENNIKFVYDEYKTENIVDEVSGNVTQTIKFLSKYYYEINTSTYEPSYKGKYQVK